MAALPPAHTVHDAMVACGINDVNRFLNETEAQRLATDLFHDSFYTCMERRSRKLIAISRTIWF